MWDFDDGLNRDRVSSAAMRTSRDEQQYAYLFLSSAAGSIHSSPSLRHLEQPSRPGWHYNLDQRFD